MKRTLLVCGTTALWFLSSASASAGVTIGIDIATLNRLLPALVPSEVLVPISEDGSLTIHLEDLTVHGFEPGPGDDDDGEILTSVRVLVPQFGLELPLEPRLALRILDAGRLLELRFVEAHLALPIAGKLDIARFMAPLRFPVESVFLLAGAQGDVQVTSRIAAVRMGRKVIRFELDLQPSAPAGLHRLPGSP